MSDLMCHAALHVLLFLLLALVLYLALVQPVSSLEWKHRQDYVCAYTLTFMHSMHETSRHARSLAVHDTASDACWCCRLKCGA